MKKKKEKYCFLTPPFPLKGYLVITYSSNEQGEEYIGALYDVFPTIAEAAAKALEEKQNLKKHKIKLDKYLSLIPLQFKALHKNKKEFWEKPTQEYNNINRIEMMVSMMANPKMYKLLVTAGYRRKKWSFWGAVPFYTSADNSTVEKFMLRARWPVDIKTKYAAFYTAEEQIIYNLEEKRVIETPESDETEDLLLN